MTPRLQPLIATSIVGIGSVITLMLSVVAMKFYAVEVGPTGVGVFALLQSVLNVAVLVTTLGLQASTITVVAATQGRNGSNEALSVGLVAVGLVTVTTTLGAALMLAFSDQIAGAVLGGRDRGTDLLPLVLALPLTGIATVLAAIMVGIHQLKAATAAQLAAAFLGTAVMIALVASLGTDGFASGLAVFAGLQVVCAAVALATTGVSARGLGSIVQRLRELLGLGLSVVVSQGITSGVLFLMPVVVLYLLGPQEVGLYRAAMAVSVGIGTFFLAGIHQDFLPRIASAGDPVERAELIERRIRIVVGIGLPVVLALLASGPALLLVLYSDEFHLAEGILQWQLIGDMLRLPSIVMAVATLAMRKRLTYFGLEVASGVALIAATVFATAAFGLDGPGMGYAAAGFVSLALSQIAIYRALDLRPGRLQLIVMVAAAGSALIVATGLPPTVRFIVFGGAAVGAGLVTWPRLLRLHRQRSL